MSNEKDKFASNVKCGHCCNVAPMQIVGSHDYEEELQTNPPGMGYVCVTYHEMLLCPACNGINLRSAEWGPWSSPDDGLSWQLLYPAPVRAPMGMARPVARAYEAASRVRNIDSNAYAVLLGRVLDHVCSDRKAEGKTLSARLNALVTKGDIPKTLADMAHELRALRNVGAHAELGELTTAEVPVLDDLCRAILEYVYSAPELLARVRNRLDGMLPSVATKEPRDS